MQNFTESKNNIVAIRHTKVDIKKGICYGQSDIGLADSFSNEKKIIQSHIKTYRFDIVFSSPLIRCKQLAIALFPDKQIIYDNRLMELDFGDWEAKHWDDIYKAPYSKIFFNDYINTPCPGGESFQDLIKRVSAFYHDIELNYSAKQIAIVCHGGTIRAFMCAINGVSAQHAFSLKIDYGQTISEFSEINK